MDVVVDPAAWKAAAFGGVLLGIAAALLLWLNGRIAGISGAVGGLVLDRNSGDTAWRALFLGGIVIGALLVALLSPAGLHPRLQTGTVGMIVAGLLVGAGTRMGNGCTSGHGLCGLARFSGRSVVALATFMAVAMITVYVLRHLGGAS